MRRAGYYLTGYTWTVSFVIPRGDTPELRVDPSTIRGPNATAVVRTMFNGSTIDLWYEPIPAWMTEVPVQWATSGELASNVEVYRRTAAGDHVKAVCDKSGNAGTDFSGMTKGSEFDCAYHYTASSTAIVSDYAIVTYIDSYTVLIGINGSGFLMGGLNETVRTTVDGHICNITLLLDNYVECKVSHVPWGRHAVAVHLGSHGYALSVASKLLDFRAAVYSFEPKSGSLSGGQRITVLGRGFRANTTVSMGSGLCEIVFRTSSTIECITPAAFSSNVSDIVILDDGNITDVVSTVWESLSNVTVDGVVASDLYNFSISSTPMVHSVSPNEISSAISTVVEIFGEGFESNTTVTISGQTCIIQELYDDMIVCLLLRSGARPVIETQVLVHVPAKGYAAEASSPVDTPMARFGFELQSVYPSTGSVMGGTLLRLNGFGFLESNASRHAVLMEDLDNPVTERDQLLWDLGLLDERPAALVCRVQEVSFHHITCYVPKFTEGQHSEHCAGSPGGHSSRFELAATLNDMTALCAIVDDCTYSQLNTSTPMVDLAYVTAVNESSGAMTIELQGSEMLHMPGRVSVYLNERECRVTSVSSTLITTECPPVTAGELLVEAYVDGIGWAHITPTVNIGEGAVVITAVNPHASVGSIGGGTVVDILGFGFSPNCSENVVVLNITGDVLVQLDPNDLKECTVNRMRLATPSIKSLYGNSFAVSSASHRQVVEVYILTKDIASNSHGMEFSYSASGTPQMTSSPASGYVHDNITIVVTAPTNGATAADLNVMIGNHTCHHFVASQISPTTFHIICGGPAAQGDVMYPVLVDMRPFGAALTSSGHVPTYKSNFQVINMAPSVFVSSVAGGSALTLHGRGFSSQSFVTVCDKPCTLRDISYDSVVCRTPPHMTLRAVEHFDRLGAHIESIENLDATRFGSRTTSLANVEDGNYNTYYSHDVVGCYLGLRLPTGYKARPHRLRFYPRLQYADLIRESVFEASNDGGVTYTVLDRITRAHEGWNYFEANATMKKKWFTHFRFRSINPTTVTRCMISELRVLGVVASESSTCSVKVGSSSLSTLTTVGTVQYNGSAMTPYIESVSPRNGTALGGTLVRIRGFNLDALSIPMSDRPTIPMGITAGDMDHSTKHTSMSHNVTQSMVVFNGMCCMVNYSTPNEIGCITTERDLDHVHHADTYVYIAGRGNAIANPDAKFMYIDRWSDLTTWRNQEPPVAGDLVWIPEGQVILLDVSTPVISMLLIEGELYFDPTRDVNLDASYVYVNGGRLQVGTAEDPYLRNANITLHGDRYKTIELPHIGSKCLAVASKGMVHNHGGGDGTVMPEHATGALEIHGAKRLRTWTKLGETAHAGSDFIVTSEPVDFKLGERIIIPGTEVPEGGIFQDEVVTVVSNDDSHTVFFSPPLQYTHRSEIVVVEGRTIDLRCEVGLLTRNVKIQGDESSDGQMFGVHTIGMSGTFRIENVEVTRCGQAFVLGRYCTHAHHGGNFEGNYIKANSIHHSFQRAVTTHDTSYWEVRDNVAYDVMGHTYFVEDGTEFYNSFTGNLGIRTKTSSALLASDVKPAVFWTTNPNNFWYDNVAVHSHSFGYWFELPVGPPPGGATVCCTHEHLGAFRNNTARAHGVLGLRIYPEWTPHEDPCDTSSPPAPQYLYDFLSYRNSGNGMFSKKHGDLHHIGYTFLENAAIDISILHYLHVTYTKDPTFMNTYIIDNLSENFNINANSGGLGVLAPQDEFFYMKDTTAINYGTTPVLSGCNDCDGGEFMNQGARTYRFEGLKFVNSTRRTIWSRHYKQIFWDLDGSLAGHPNSYVLQWYDFNAWSPLCSRLPLEGYGDSMLCINTTVRRVEIDYVTPNQVDFTDLRIFGGNRSSELYFLPMDIYGWVAPLVTGHTYSLEWTDADVSPRAFSFHMGCRQYIEEVIANGGNEVIGMQFAPKPYNYNPYSFNVHYDGVWKWSDINDTVTLADHMARSSFVNGTLDVILSTKDANMELQEPFAVQVKAQLCPPVGCPIPPPPSLPANYSLWSDFKSWKSNVKPTFNEDVVIEADMWIHMDVSPPPLNKLTVYGKLTFKSGLKKKLQLTVGTLLVYGFVEVAGKDKSPFNGEAEIILQGGKQTSLPVIVGADRFIGSKVLAVMGELTMVGKPTVESWVRLAEPAQAGGTSALLRATSLGWAVGDEIVFSPTSYFGMNGELWSAPSGSVEFRTVTAVLNMAGNVTKVSFTTPLQQTHFCGVMEEQSFCGAVGLVSRNVKILSKDSENAQDVTNYGFGGHISVIDLVEELYSADRYFSGTVYLNSVELKNLGKVSSEYYAISFSYTGSHESNVITNCSFNKGYNFALKAAKTNDIIFRNNIAVGNWGGGVYIEKTCRNVTVTNNLVVGVHQLPSVLKSLYPWTRPVAAFTIESVDGIVKNNLAAGSYDQGFAIATKYFFQPHQSICAVTRGLAYTYDEATFVAQRKFSNNEAVGCKGGLMVMAMDAAESRPEDCVIVNGIVAWRNAHAGIMAVAAEANIIVAGVVLAENHIGVVLDYFKTSDRAFSGVVMSKIIGSLHVDGFSDLPDSNWDRRCQVFSTGDPFGLSTTCRSSISDFYHRVGVLVSQFTNRAKTCGAEGRFDQCQPPTTPDRLCAMPFDKRYALPHNFQYTEMHIHDTVFTGFRMNVTNKARSSAAVAFNPTQIDHQPNVITSGLQWEGENVHRMDRDSRFGYKTPGNTVGCDSRPCMGFDMALIHDVDGSAGGYGKAGQLVMGNPQHAAPYPLCSTASELGAGVTYCPSTGAESASTAYRQYSGIWRDFQDFKIGPIQVTKEFPEYGRNRSYAAYAPIKDMCAMRMSFSRFPLHIAPGLKHRILTTGTVPTTWYFRWDSPYATDSAILEFFIHGSNAVRVFVGANQAGPYREVPRFEDRYPTLSDPRGSSARNPQKRTLTVNVRGGTERWYKFVVVPVVAVNMKLEMDFDTFNTDNFIANIAMLLKVPVSRIKVADVRRGSVIIDWVVDPDPKTLTIPSDPTPSPTKAPSYGHVISNSSNCTTNCNESNVTTIYYNNTDWLSNVTSNNTNTTYDNADTAAETAEQVAEMQLLVTRFAEVVMSGELEETLDVPIDTLTLYEPTIVEETEDYEPTYDGDDDYEPEYIYVGNATNSSNSTPAPTPFPTPVPKPQPATSNVLFLVSKPPTSYPTGEPSSTPSGQPTHVPSGEPSGSPSLMPSGEPSSEPSGEPSGVPTQLPTGEPTGIPTQVPSGQPTSVPTSSSPTTIPSGEPSAFPSGEPTAAPSQIPTGEPSVSPSCTPTGDPSSIPSGEPTSIPTSIPSGEPSSLPSGEPSAEPTSVPSGEPSSVPSQIPTGEPSSIPSGEPTSIPTSMPSGEPSSLPSGEPSAEPTSVPSGQPSAHPSSAPSCVPSTTPTGRPTSEPSTEPTTIPSGEPSAVPSSSPSGEPTLTPSGEPSSQPSVTPTSEPTAVPSAQPTGEPTTIPSGEPSGVPTSSPSGEPTLTPSGEPSVAPSTVPSGAPSTIPSSKPSGLPSTRPSNEPTSVPSGQPTKLPTSSPSGQPSARPLSCPSTVPTGVPTTLPSYLPSAVPSGVPSVHPTGQPSSVPSGFPSAVPTTEPTTAIQTEFSMKSLVGLNGISSSDFDDDYRNAFIDGIVQSSNNTVKRKDVHVDSVSDILLPPGRRVLTGSSGVLVKFTIAVIVEKMKLSRGNAFAVLKKVLKSSVESPKMLTTMNNALSKSKGSGFTPVAVSSFEADEADSDFVSIVSSQPTSAPTPKPVADDTNETLPSWSAALFIVGGCIVLLVLFGVVCKLRHEGESKEKGIATRKKINRIAVEPNIPVTDYEIVAPTRSRSNSNPRAVNQQAVVEDATELRVKPLGKGKTPEIPPKVSPYIV